MKLLVSGNLSIPLTSGRATMTYQLTPFTNNGAAYATSDSDGNFWSIAPDPNNRRNNILWWFDGCDWQPFAIFDEGLRHVAVHSLKNIWAIGQYDRNPYNFNGIGWNPQPLPEGRLGTWLSIGFDDGGTAWCLDDADTPQIWLFDSGNSQWDLFSGQSSSDVAFIQISGGYADDNSAIFLVALDDKDQEWLYTNDQGIWKLIPDVTQGHGLYIAASPDQSVFAVGDDNALYKWKSGVDDNWVLLDNSIDYSSISIDSEDRLLAVDSGNNIYAGLESPPDQKGFRGSDWDNAGKMLYAVRYDRGAGCDILYRSENGGLNFEDWYHLPAVPYRFTSYYWFAIPLMIPTTSGGTEKMLVSPIGSQTLYLCDDINQDKPTFNPVTFDPPPDSTCCAGIFNGFAEDEDGNLYAGWYAINSAEYQAILYKATPTDSYQTWKKIANWQARHIHTVRVNPYNGYLYVILGEPNYIAPGLPTTDATDAGKIMRSKNGGSSWHCVTDTWSTPVAPDVQEPPIYLGLYFSTLGFIKDCDRVVLGEDTDWKQGRIFYFDDDGREDPDSPFIPQLCYTTANQGEFFLGAVCMGDTLYFATQFLAPTIARQGSASIESTRCVSTKDGITWRLEQLCVAQGSYSSNPNDNSCLGVLTYHPERGGRLIYSLSIENSYFIDQPE